MAAVAGAAVVGRRTPRDRRALAGQDANVAVLECPVWPHGGLDGLFAEFF